MSCRNNGLTQLPFFNLSDQEFCNLIGSCTPSLSERLGDNIDLLNVLPNPDKHDERDSDLMLIPPCSEYYETSKLNKLLNSSYSSKICFSIFHCNIRSLPKNLPILEDWLYSLEKKSDILAISETKLNSKSIINTDIPQYHFFHTDSETAAGGAALYISNNLKAIPRADIKFTMPLVETCWAEIIANSNKPNIIIGCIYRHPSANMPGFTQELQNIIKSLSNRKQHVYIIGNVNVNFLKYNEHANNEDYLNMLYSNNFLPLITKPTRLTDHSSTLIDHIYTNAPIENTTSGIALADISDHLPVFCICNAPTSKNKHVTYYRDYSNFCKEQYLADISQINWPDLYSTSTDLHEITCACTNKVKDIVNKHAPLKKATNSKMKQLNKPWLTQGLLKSIKRKQKMSKSHFFSKNSMKIKEYKQYSNLLNKMKAKAKDKYYNQYFQLYKENLKETWKLIGTIIKRKAKVKSNCSSRIIRNSKIYTNELDIANQFNQHFTTIGPNLASAINPIYDNPTKYIRNSPANSFYLSAVTEEYVAQLFSNLNERKASLDIPNKLIKLASHELSKPFSYIYNQSIVQGIVPNVLKV